MAEEPVRVVKPVVVPAQLWVWGPVVAGFVSVFPAMFTFILSNALIMTLGDPFANLRHGPVFGYGVAVFVVSFVAVFALVAMKVHQEPKLTTYAIYPDHIDYDEGLFTRTRSTLLFDQVTDVTLTESVLQQPQGVGTVTLVTRQLVSGPNGKLGQRRIELKNVPQPREVYELLRSLALKKAAG